jgi:hypothetical protein
MNETIMANPQLSPAAQAVLDAVGDCYKEDIPEDRDIIIATLRAAANQVVPEFWHEDEDIYGWTMQDIRKELFAIAAELEGSND